MFTIICFTIDQVVGYTFYKVLFRFIITYLKKNFPNNSLNDVSEELEKKTKYILNYKDGLLSVKSIILPKDQSTTQLSLNIYEPSYLTKRMVSTICGIKLEEKYSEEDNDNTFNLILELISGNDVLPISNKSKMIQYLKKTINPYFRKYYTIAIKTLNNLTSNYENMIQNQYVLLDIISKLLKDLKDKPYQNQGVIENNDK